MQKFNDTEFLKDLEGLSDSEDEEMNQEEDFIEPADLQLEEKEEITALNSTKLINEKEFEEHLTEIKSGQAKNVMALVGKTTEYLRQVAPELSRVHKQCRDSYHSRFPELESIIPNPVDLTKVIRTLGNGDENGQELNAETIAAKLNWLPNTTVMSLTVAFSAAVSGPVTKLSNAQYKETL